MSTALKTTAEVTNIPTRNRLLADYFDQSDAAVEEIKEVANINKYLSYWKTPARRDASSSAWSLTFSLPWPVSTASYDQASSCDSPDVVFLSHGGTWIITEVKARKPTDESTASSALRNISGAALPANVSAVLQRSDDPDDILEIYAEKVDDDTLGFLLRL